MAIDLKVSRIDHMSRCRDAERVLGFPLRKRFDKLREQQSDLVGLTSFDVDKTMRLVDKLWEKRAAMILEKNRDDEIQRFLNGRLCYFPVDRNYNDKHGHRIAHPPADETPEGTTRKQRPVLDVIESFDQVASPTERVFEIIEVEEDWGKIKRYQPQISVSSLTPLLLKGRIDRDDVTFLSRLGDVCGILSEQEMQALGRHESPNATLDSLLEEFDRWQDRTRLAFERLERKGPNSSPAELDALAESVWDCWSFALECRKKAGLDLSDDYSNDKLLYRVALEKLAEELSRTIHVPSDELDANKIITSALHQAQPPASSIWNDARVAVLEFPSFCIWEFAVYFCGSLKELREFEGTELATRLSKIDKNTASNAFDSLRRIINIDFGARPGAFTPTWWQSVPRAVGELFDVLVSPSDFLTSINLPEFSRGAHRVFVWLCTEHIGPCLESRRMQEVN